jgi:hypothetical protein
LATISCDGSSSSSGSATPRAAPPADQQDPPAAQLESEVCLEIGDQTDAIGVVPADFIRREGKRVHRARGRRPQGRPGRQGVGFVLEREGDVQPPAALVAELRHHRPEPVQGRAQPAVGEVLPGLARERGVYLGRKAVLDGIADYRVFVGH